MILYRILHVIFPAFFRLLGAKDFGAENMPQEGGVIVAANHMSNWDPPFLASFLQRPVSYMAKQELFEIPIFGTVIRWLFAFPVRQGAADRYHMVCRFTDTGDEVTVQLMVGIRPF